MLAVFWWCRLAGPAPAIVAAALHGTAAGPGVISVDQLGELFAPVDTAPTLRPVYVIEQIATAIDHGLVIPGPDGALQLPTPVPQPSRSAADHLRSVISGEVLS